MVAAFAPQISRAQISELQPPKLETPDTTVGANVPPPDVETPPDVPKKTEKQLRAEALKNREAAELRIEADMQNMTNIVEALFKNLGQIHYLRALCFGTNDQKWRNYAYDMMQIEAPDSQERRSQFIRAFNAGYYQEQERHSQCSNKVSVDVAALAENSRNLATMLGDPFRER